MLFNMAKWQGKSLDLLWLPSLHAAGMNKMSQIPNLTACDTNPVCQVVTTMTKAATSLLCAKTNTAATAITATATATAPHAADNNNGNYDSNVIVLLFTYDG